MVCLKSSAGIGVTVGIVMVRRRRVLLLVTYLFQNDIAEPGRINE